jgi:hypothetical protein
MLLIGTNPNDWELVADDCIIYLLNVFTYFDVVKDCGCFGDALKLKPWDPS